MARTRTLPTLAALALAAALAPSAARGQTCDAGDSGAIPSDLLGVLRDTFPADQGFAVPTDTPIRLRYFGRAPTPPTVCVRQVGQVDCLQGTAVAVGDEVVWQGAQPLAARRDHQVVFADASGGTNRITFSTAGGVSGGPPSFDGIGTISVQGNTRDDCDPNAVDLTVRFDRARNDGVGVAWPESDIEYVIYQTRGPGVSGPRERDRVRLQRSGSTGDTSAQRTFRLAGVEATGPACFNVQAIDPRGRPDGNTIERCVNPAQGNYFQGCRAAPTAARGHGALVALALAAGVALSRRRRA